MFLGIEIGGTKLQLAAGKGDGSQPEGLVRQSVARQKGAQGIRDQLLSLAPPLLKQYEVQAIGIGFGGPVDSVGGRVLKSHQISGWDDFPLAAWAQEAFGLPVVLANDSDSAGFAEAQFGAGQGQRIVVYSNVGSGIGGALVIAGNLYTGSGGIAAEIGHLRPGLQSEKADQTVESLASGWAIAASVQSLVADPVSHRLGAFIRGGRPRGPESVRQRLIEREEAHERAAGELLERCEGRIERLTTEMVAQAAEAGNELAIEAFRRACQAFGWALAQVITLLSPNIVVIGGGVAGVGEKLFLTPLRQEVERYVFPPLAGSYQIVPAVLDELVVVHGALALARRELASA